ncbi:MAG: aminopeptidase P family protein [Calditrichaeota bacterium]|nr:aminopeptidase P family protein [Calditrichota bacterium]
MVKDRISALRDLMKRENIKAYIIPSIDAHQSEYVPDLWQRRPWISGFTGSAGDVAITLDKGGLWTDGRYYAQATEQLAGSGIDLFKASEKDTPTIPAFLGTELNAGDKVGIDPKTFSFDQMQSLKKDIDQAGMDIDFTENNFVDRVWENQPGLPDRPIKVHTLKFAGESVESKLGRIRNEMKKNGSKAHVITMLDAIAWTFNLRGKDVDFNPVFIAYAIITEDSAKLFTKLSRVPDEVHQFIGSQVEILDYPEFDNHLLQLAESAEKVWIDGATTNYWIVSTLAKKCALVNSMSPVIKFKAIKNDAELDGYRACHVRDGVAMVNFLHWLEGAVPTGGVTEMSAAKKLEGFRKEQDMFQGPSFGTISSYKIHGAIIHYSVTEESDIPLNPTGVYLIDSGGQYLDGTTDITRTVTLGDVTESEKENFTRVLMGHINLNLTAFPKGTTGPALDTITRLALWEAGLNFNHGTGHGVGSYLGVHEGPQSINPTRGFTVPLEIGMICSNEPGYYKAGEYGMRIENLINVIRDDEKSNSDFEFYTFDNATLCPIDTRLVEKSLMTEKQINWLNQYHAEVWQKLSPFVEGDVKSWLQKATEEI